MHLKPEVIEQLERVLSSVEQLGLYRATVFPTLAGPAHAGNVWRFLEGVFDFEKIFVDSGLFGFDFGVAGMCKAAGYN